MIKPAGSRSWEIVEDPSGEARVSNGILCLLLKLHWPGMVHTADGDRPCTTFDRYYLAPDAELHNKAERVVAELWDFIRCPVGLEARGIQQAKRACPKLVTDMIYEARIQVQLAEESQARDRRAQEALETTVLRQQETLSQFLAYMQGHSQHVGHAPPLIPLPPLPVFTPPLPGLSESPNLPSSAGASNNQPGNKKELDAGIARSLFARTGVLVTSQIFLLVIV